MDIPNENQPEEVKPPEEDEFFGLNDTEREHRRILKEIMTRHIPTHDEKDVSLHPSYTNFQVPYNMQCLRRYQLSKINYEAQFQHEITQLMESQTKANEVARMVRHLAYTSLWPPLHNRHEIDHTQAKFFRLTPKQRERVNYLMANKIE